MSRRNSPDGTFIPAMPPFATAAVSPNSATVTDYIPAHMPMYPRATYGSAQSTNGLDNSTSLDTLAHSTGNLAEQVMSPLEARPVVPLMGSKADAHVHAPHAVQSPPPAIRLSPRAACTSAEHANCSPTWMRASLNVVPSDAAVLAKCKVPLALFLAPFRPPDMGDADIPVIATPNIVRCRKCRTYLNPYVQFLDRGQRWKCNLCYFPNELPESFDANSDRWQRSELNYAVVEYVAPSEYMLRPPQPAVFMFVVDVSVGAVHSGMLHAFCEILKENVSIMPNSDGRTLVGIVTVDCALHYYRLGKEPQMMVVGDMDDVFAPLPDYLLANLAECRDQLLVLLDRIPKLHYATQTTTCALGPALKAALNLISPYGGKLCAFVATRPTEHIGALQPRHETPGTGYKVDPNLVQPSIPFYKQFAVECCRFQVAVDMFVFEAVNPNGVRLAPKGYMDVASLSSAPKFTGGNVYYYPHFNTTKPYNSEKFAREFAHLLSRPLGLEAVMRIRASRGLKMSMYHGNFFVRSNDLLTLPNVNPDNTYVVELSVSEPVASQVVCFQAALLHTTAFGERRIRVLTLALPTSSSPSDLFFSMDVGCVSCLLARKAIDRAVESSFFNARDAVTNKCAEIVAAFRHIHHSGMSGLLPATASMMMFMPETARLFPLFCLGILKSHALRVAPLNLDLRAMYLDLLRIGPLETVLTMLHPTLIALHTYDGVLVPLPISSESLERNGIYLLYNGVVMYLWVCGCPDSNLLLDLFNCSQYEDIPIGPYQLTAHSEFGTKVLQLIDSFRERSLFLGTLWPMLYVVRDDDNLKMIAQTLLTEDRADYGPSYPTFLSLIRDKGL